MYTNVATTLTPCQEKPMTKEDLERAIKFFKDGLTDEEKLAIEARKRTIELLSTRYKYEYTPKKFDELEYRLLFMELFSKNDFIKNIHFIGIIAT